ncbi:MAG: hypothetical protein Tsb005_11080 [Gammaproteobacteria bacterium]
MITKKLTKAALLEKFNQLTTRERIVVSGTILFVVFLLWQLLFNMPVNKRLASLSATHQQTSTKIRDLTQQANTILLEAKENPRFKLQRQQQDLEEQRYALQQRLANVASQLMVPEEVVTFLENMLAHQKELQLINLTTQEPVLITDRAEKKTLYRHEIVINMQGTYFGLMRYIDRLEESSWRILWDELDYKVQAHPEAHIEIKLHTLSNRPA